MAIGKKSGQHTVPAFYLDRFAVPSRPSHIVTCSRESNKVFWQPVADATKVNNIYTLPPHLSDDPMALEDAFGEIETVAGVAFQELVETEVVSPSVRHGLTLFLAAQLKRTLFVAEHQRKCAEYLSTPEAVREYIHHSRKRLDRLIGKSRLDEFVASGGEHRIQLESSTLMLRGQQRFERYYRAIHGMKWRVLKSKDGSFITSDNPVFVRRRGVVFDPSIVGIERADLEAELCAPLTPKLYLIASWQANREPRQVSRWRTRELNRRTIVCSYKYLLAPGFNRDIISMVDEHRGFRIKIPQWSPREIAEGQYANP